ncbi:MAG: hypothetical protein OXE52_12030 [Chloroflexi bacterium]|nr:hypothetical protein [Chloroflexota bacterium]
MKLFKYLAGKEIERQRSITGADSREEQVQDLGLRWSDGPAAPGSTLAVIELVHRGG